MAVKSWVMSKKKHKRYVMWVEKDGPTAITPEIHRLLQPLILQLALAEDLTGPRCLEVERDEYLAHVATQLREPVGRSFREAGVAIDGDKRDEICRAVAGEMFVIRGLKEAQQRGEISVKDIRHLPFYPVYKEYFD